MSRIGIPDFMPHLGAGAHRTPRRGACFMEFASYLAGERWSDHPECTDPVLAALARGVNDGVSDARRDELVLQIPRVIGLRGDDAEIGMIVALRAATAALPVASMDRQHSLAVGILTLCAELDARGIEAPGLRLAARHALDDVPGARVWAENHLASVRRPSRQMHPSAPLAIARISAAGIAQACIDDPDSLLIATLDLAISDVEARLAARDRHLEAVPA